MTASTGAGVAPDRIGQFCVYGKRLQRKSPPIATHPVGNGRKRPDRGGGQPTRNRPVGRLRAKIICVFSQ
jgi:hypothetical protein